MPLPILLLGTTANLGTNTGANTCADTCAHTCPAADACPADTCTDACPAADTPSAYCTIAATSSGFPPDFEPRLRDNPGQIIANLQVGRHDHSRARDGLAGRWKRKVVDRRG